MQQEQPLSIAPLKATKTASAIIFFICVFPSIESIIYYYVVRQKPTSIFSIEKKPPSESDGGYLFCSSPHHGQTLFVASSLNRCARIASLGLGAAATDHGTTEGDQNGDSDKFLHLENSPMIDCVLHKSDLCLPCYDMIIYIP